MQESHMLTAKYKRASCISGTELQGYAWDASIRAEASRCAHGNNRTDASTQDFLNTSTF